MNGSRYRERIRIGFFLPPLQGVAGVARYANELMRALSRHAQKEFEFITFFGQNDLTYELPPASQLWRNVPTNLAQRRTATRLMTEHLLLWKLLKKYDIGIYHGLNNVIPAICPRRSICTVHDLSFVSHPEVHTAPKRVYWGMVVPASVRKAARVIAISNVTADDMRKKWNVPREKISVVPHGLSRLRNIVTHSAPLALSGVEGLFFLFVGTIEPRKNLAKLLRAFQIVSEKIHVALKLVVAGKRGWKTDEFDSLLSSSPVRNNVLLLGYVTDSELAWLYDNAAAFVYPSLYEGFGLPILEAMAFGTPVVTSIGSATGEVAGGAAILVDPQNVDSLAAAMEAAATDQPLRQRLKAAGPVRAAQFTWDRTADATLAAYRAVVNDLQ